MIFKVLFVCLGNICRSPAAEAVLKKKLQERNWQNLFEVSSAGIGPWHVGEKPDKRMIRCGKQRGYVLDSIAQQIKKEDLAYYDYLLVMDDENLCRVQAMAQSEQETAKIEKLSNYLPEIYRQTSIPDPYWGGENEFENTLTLIEQAIEGWMDVMKKHPLMKERS